MARMVSWVCKCVRECARERECVSARAFVCAQCVCVMCVCVYSVCVCVHVHELILCLLCA